MEKKFDDWNNLKKQLDDKTHLPTFRQREIWWCNLGVNIGHEENGKGKEYSRPVLILRKFNPHIFWGIPLTTQIKDTAHYHQITFREKNQCLMLSQLKLFEGKRLINKMGKITKNQFNDIRKEIKDIV